MRILVVLFVMLFIFSCKKEKIEEPEVKYDIYVNTIDSLLSYHYIVTNSGPRMELDISGNGNIDVFFYLKEYYWTDDFGTHSGDSYVKSVSMTCNYRSTAVSVFWDSTSNQLLKYGDLISDSYFLFIGGPNLYFRRYEYASAFQIIDEEKILFEKTGGEGYVGVLKIIGDNKYYGWIRLKVSPFEVIVYESGFNRVPNVPIRIGQKN